MRIGLDTSVLLRLLTGEPADLATAAVRRIESALRGGDSVLASDLVVSEAYFALQHHYGLSKAEAIATLAALLHESGIEAAGAAGRVLAMPHLATARPGFVDRLIHAEYTQIADEMLIFERPAARLPRARVLRP